MTERTAFECDVTGEWFRDRGDVFEIEHKRRSQHDPFRISTMKIHLSDDAVDESPARMGTFSVLKRIYTDGGEIIAVGIKTKSDSYSHDTHIQNVDRDSVRVDQFDDFLDWLEDEVVL